jgi:hypothetical protein
VSTLISQTPADHHATLWKAVWDWLLAPPEETDAGKEGQIGTPNLQAGEMEPSSKSIQRKSNRTPSTAKATPREAA